VFGVLIQMSEAAGEVLHPGANVASRADQSQLPLDSLASPLSNSSAIPAREPLGLIEPNRLSDRSTMHRPAAAVVSLALIHSHFASANNVVISYVINNLRDYF
jgi:hypothetical protein